jgi:hypothetical protein
MGIASIAPRPRGVSAQGPGEQPQDARCQRCTARQGADLCRQNDLEARRVAQCLEPQEITPQAEETEPGQRDKDDRRSGDEQPATGADQKRENQQVHERLPGAVILREQPFVAQKSQAVLDGDRVRNVGLARFELFALLCGLHGDFGGFEAAADDADDMPVGDVYQRTAAVTLVEGRIKVRRPKVGMRRVAWVRYSSPWYWSRATEKV